MPAGKIVQLPDSVANQIAAGEVVERPVAVVKELVENALDAGARSVEVHFEEGGISAIRVIDDGCGMSRDDAVLALQRHATSKIRTADDLLRVGTFGFRGEALPSIASVSQFTLRTREAQAIGGTEIRVTGGKSAPARDCGMSPGTEVVVERLFFNVPARRKFLKSNRTEAAHIIQLVRLLAIAHPTVAFALLEDGHTVFRSAACADPLQRVREILGRRRADELFAFSHREAGVELSGLMGKPSIGRSTRGELITYVNRRPVDSRLLNYALIETYHRYLPNGRYPVGFFFVQLDGADVDVNVHPAKREVRFREELPLRRLVMSALADALAQQASLPVAGFLPVNTPTALARPVPAAALARPVNAASPARPVPAATAPAVPVPAVPVPATPRGDQLIWLARLHSGLGLFQGRGSLVVINPVAAMERIGFERICQQLQGDASCQQLLIPALLELPPLDAGILGDQLPFFAAIGFEIELFGRHTFRLCACPAWLAGESAESFVEELVAAIRDRGLQPDDRTAALRMIARMGAARGARGFAPADAADWQQLAKDLLACENPLLDSRGRATLIELRDSELARRLGLNETLGRS